ncbi:hypothetical protein IHE44_0014093 [Lamprotornis superbus]|uniref:Uncharacterized protein n=1 Tax=Lamprotornis superbus TaxID=245042 RepID=A0A835TUP0_9PASS|nr:hypothetical protein IHE44_0014093 [Lamprotornis superbus]
MGDDIHIAAFFAGVTADLYQELFPADLALSWYLVMLNGIQSKTCAVLYFQHSGASSAASPTEWVPSTLLPNLNLLLTALQCPGVAAMAAVAVAQPGVEALHANTRVQSVSKFPDLVAVVESRAETEKGPLPLVKECQGGNGKVGRVSIAAKSTCLNQSVSVHKILSTEESLYTFQRGEALCTEEIFWDIDCLPLLCSSLNRDLAQEITSSPQFAGCHLGSHQVLRAPIPPSGKNPRSNPWKSCYRNSEGVEEQTVGRKGQIKRLKKEVLQHLAELLYLYTLCTELLCKVCRGKKKSSKICSSAEIPSLESLRQGDDLVEKWHTVFLSLAQRGGRGCLCQCTLLLPASLLTRRLKAEMLTRKYRSSFHCSFTMKYELSDWSVSSAVKKNSGLLLKRVEFREDKKHLINRSLDEDMCCYTCFWSLITHMLKPVENLGKLSNLAYGDIQGTFFYSACIAPVFQHGLPAVTENIYLKKSLTSTFYTSCVSSVVNCATLSVLSLFFSTEFLMNGCVARGLREDALNQHLFALWSSASVTWGDCDGGESFLEFRKREGKKALCSEQRSLHKAHSVVETNQVEKQVMQGLHQAQRRGSKGVRRQNLSFYFLAAGCSLTVRDRSHTKALIHCLFNSKTFICLKRFETNFKLVSFS